MEVASTVFPFYTSDQSNQQSKVKNLICKFDVTKTRGLIIIINSHLIDDSRAWSRWKLSSPVSCCVHGVGSLLCNLYITQLKTDQICEKQTKLSYNTTIIESIDLIREKTWGH